eukprot:gb/GECH01011470.1/.p1 GENE.gb/GECH01011470.1/~~gb/GECH01011470.1/.p1  ORF type:complete len:955 (+),score=199.69 gb/GECH01011470.1/:1-2865(+)
MARKQKNKSKKKTPNTPSFNNTSNSSTASEDVLSTTSSSSSDLNSIDANTLSSLTLDKLPEIRKSLKTDSNLFHRLFESNEDLEEFMKNLRNFIEKKENGKISLGFVGTTGVGKSTFINALLALSCISEQNYPNSVNTLRFNEFEVFKDEELLMDKRQINEHGEPIPRFPDPKLFHPMRPNDENTSMDSISKAYIEKYRDYWKNPVQYKSELVETNGFLLPVSGTSFSSKTNAMITVKYGAVPQLCVVYDNEDRVQQLIKQKFKSSWSQDLKKVEKKQCKRFVESLTGINDVANQTLCEKFKNAISRPHDLENSNIEEWEEFTFPIKESLVERMNKEYEIWTGNGQSLEQDLSFIRNKLNEITEWEASTSSIIDQIVVYTPCKILQNGVDLIDIPGCNDTNFGKSFSLEKALKKQVYLVLLLNKNYSAAATEQQMLEDSMFFDRLRAEKNTHLFVFTNLEKDFTQKLFKDEKKIQSQRKEVQEEGKDALEEDIERSPLDGSETDASASQEDLSPEEVQDVMNDKVTISAICPHLLVSILLDRNNPQLRDNIDYYIDVAGGSDFLEKLNHLVVEQQREATDNFGDAEFRLESLLKTLTTSDSSIRKIARNRLNWRKNKDLKSMHWNMLQTDEWNATLKRRFEDQIKAKLDYFLETPFDYDFSSNAAKLFRKVSNMSAHEVNVFFDYQQTSFTQKSVKQCNSIYWYYCKDIMNRISRQSPQVQEEIDSLLHHWVQEKVVDVTKNLIGGFFPDHTNQDVFISALKEFTSDKFVNNVHKEFVKARKKEFANRRDVNDLRDCFTEALAKELRAKRKVFNTTVTQRDIQESMENVARSVKKSFDGKLTNLAYHIVENITLRLTPRQNSLLSKSLHRFCRQISDDQIFENHWLTKGLQNLLKTCREDSGTMSILEEFIIGEDYSTHDRARINSSPHKRHRSDHEDSEDSPSKKKTKRNSHE